MNGNGNAGKHWTPNKRRKLIALIDLQEDVNKLNQQPFR